MTSTTARVLFLHISVLATLATTQFVASDYVVLSLARIMVLGVYAMGYNILYGYAGMLSLGHAMFFATGLYAAAIGATHFCLTPPAAFVSALAIGIAVSVALGAVLLRAASVAFMIVTLMFSQAAYLATFYFGDVTRGDEGIVIPDAIRVFSLFGLPVNLADASTRYNLALALLGAVMALNIFLVRSRFGHVIVAIRENESRTEMLGYNVERHKLIAFAISGVISALAGAAYALMFAFAGSTLASIQYSIQPLLWTLVGGAGTVLGPPVGAALMYLLVDVASSYTNANLLAVGIVLIASVLFFPKGVLGEARRRWAPWLP